jgi:hypothetical protein
MRLLPNTCCGAILGLCLLGVAGCGEDNEAASRDRAAKSPGLVNPSKTLPQAKTQAEFFKNNPGSNPGATGTGSAAGKKTGGAPAPKKEG